MTVSSEIKIEPLYVVDTHALIWFLLAGPKLGNNAKKVFDAAERGETHLAISAIVFAELYFVNQKWSYFGDFATTYKEISQKPYIRVIPIKPQDILDFGQDEAIPEMHDRIIVGLARRLDAPLLTKDQPIWDADIVSVVW